MKIYKTADSALLHSNSLEGEKIYVLGGDAGNLIFQNGKFTYEIYGLDIKLGRFYEINGDVFRKKTITSLEVKTSITKLENASGKEPNLKKEILNGIPENNSTRRNGNVFSCYVRDHPEKRIHSILLCDIGADSVISTQINSIFHSLFGGEVYGFDKKGKSFCKLDMNLNNIWNYSFNGEKFSGGKGKAKLPLEVKDSIVAFFGHGNVERIKKGNRIYENYSDGMLYSFDKSSGNLRWKNSYQSSIDDLFLYGDKLFVLSLDKVFIIDSETGFSIAQINIDGSDDYDRSIGGFIFVDEAYIYVTQSGSSCINLYDSNTFNKQKIALLPAGYFARDHIYTDKYSGKQYFQLLNNTQYVARNPLLEIDPQNIDGDIGFEEEPDIKIYLDNPEGEENIQELCITLNSPSLDNALRFGEIYTRDEAQRHGYSHAGIGFVGRKPTENFNGVVRFIYSGCDQSETVVTEKLRIMEQRFDAWNKEEAFYACHDKQQLVKLIAEYRP